MSILCIQYRGTNPYFSLAAEEYLLKNFTEDVFMLWRSEPSIVVGKHQNALAEINHRFVKENQIKVARRISGGGTVFHDPGNLNFTFIQNVEQIDQVNFKVFTKPVIRALGKLGIEAYSSGRNDLLVDGKKISGNAEHVFKKRVLHHGTLLFDSKLEHLKKALKVDLSRFKDKSVQSNRSEVTNIANHLSEKISIEEFASFIFDGISNEYPEAVVFEFSGKDIEAIEKLRDEKYSQWNWIYGYSPKYMYTNSVKTNDGVVEFRLKVEKGLIRETTWGGAISENLRNVLNNLLIECPHEFDAISGKLATIGDGMTGDFKLSDLLEKMV